MKQKKKILWMLLPVLIFGGCGSQGSVLKRTQEESSLLETQEKEPETADGAETKDGQEENPEQTEESLPEWIYVDVCGAVENPGVYRIEARKPGVSGVRAGGRLYRGCLAGDGKSGRSVIGRSEDPNLYQRGNGADGR